MTRPLAVASLLLAACSTPSAATAPAGAAPPRLVSTTSREDRFFLAAQGPDGGALSLILDTGGGLYLTRAAVERLGLPTAEVPGEEGERMLAASLPTPGSGEWYPSLPVFGGRLPVAPAEGPAHLDDGNLGQAYFAGRVWTLDYPARQLWLRPPGDLPASPPAHRAPLGFPVEPGGERRTNYPRLTIEVDGQPLEVLLDTGASVLLSAPALAALGDGRAADRGTSFIVRSVFDAWHAKHPAWRVVEGADARMRGEPMIEVPEVVVAGHRVGPVWFTRRPDPALRQWMSSYMDREVVGALGGSGLRFFRLTLDYPGAQAFFER